MIVNILFLLLFISQIWLLSYYLPGKIIGRIKLVIYTYPPQDYPKLYPKSLDAMTLGLSIYKGLNVAILFVGIALLVLQGIEFSTWKEQSNVWEGMPLMYGMLQCLPFLLLEIWGYKQFKLMRQSDHRKVRTAVLQARGLFDFISPLVLVLTLLLFLASIVINLYLPDFAFHLNADVMVIVGAILLANGVIAASIYYSVYGKKQDPYQADQDRFKQIKVVTRSGVSVSLMVSVYLIGKVLSDTYQMESVEIILNSIYFQVLALLSIGAQLNTLKLEDTNFDVYKANGDEN
jgi:hypothetical protein